VSDQSQYNREYWLGHKADIVAKRRARRLGMTKAEREAKRAKARERDRQRRAKIAELIALVAALPRSPLGGGTSFAGAGIAGAGDPDRELRMGNIGYD
jgi:hypothetical protein